MKSVREFLREPSVQALKAPLAQGYFSGVKSFHEQFVAANLDSNSGELTGIVGPVGHHIANTKRCGGCGSLWVTIV